MIVQQTLVVNVGAVGDALPVANRSAKKLVSVVGLGANDSVDIEISPDGIKWCFVKTIKGSAGANQTAKFTYPATEMRINATNAATGGITASVESSAAITGTVVIPTPALNTNGASVDIRSLGALAALTLADLDAGSIRLETSDKDTAGSWSPVHTFTADDCVVKNVVGNFIRAVSIGASVANLFLVAESTEEYFAHAGVVEWREGAPATKLLSADAWGTFHEAHARCLELLDAGYSSVRLLVDSTFATDMLTIDPGGAAEATIPVCTVGLRPGEATSDYDMSKIMPYNQFTKAFHGFSNNNPNITWADNARWLNLAMITGNGMALVSSSEVTEAIQLTGELVFDGAIVKSYAATTLAKPVYKLLAFGALLPASSKSFNPLLGNEDFATQLAPALDINGSFCIMLPTGAGFLEAAITDSVGGGFVQVINQGASTRNNFNQPGLAGSTLYVGGTDPGYRGAQPGRPIIIRKGPLTVDASQMWGFTLACDTTLGDVTLSPLPTAAIGAGESFHAINAVGGGLVNLIPAAGEEVDISTLGPGASATLESDGSILGGTGRWVSVAGNKAGNEAVGVQFAPGDPEGSRGNIAVTWPEFMVKFAQLPAGPKFMVMNATWEDCVIPAGAYDLAEGVFTDTPGPMTNVNLIIEDGVTFQNFGSFQFVHNGWTIDNRSVSGPVITFDGGFHLLNYGTSGGGIASTTQLVGGSPLIALINGATVVHWKGLFAFFGPRDGNPDNQAWSESPAIDVDETSTYVPFLVGGGYARNAIGGDGTVVAVIFQSAVRSVWGPEDWPAFNGTTIVRALASFTTAVLGPSAGPIDQYLESLALCSTAGAPVVVNLRSVRHRVGEKLTVKDNDGNALANNITVNAFALNVSAALTYVADDGSGNSEITGADFSSTPAAVGFQPGANIVISGTAGNNISAVIKSIVGTTGIQLVGLVLANEGPVASDVDYQELIEGAASILITNNGGAIVLRQTGDESLALISRL